MLQVCQFILESLPELEELIYISPMFITSLVQLISGYFRILEQLLNIHFTSVNLSLGFIFGTSLSLLHPEKALTPEHST